MNVYCFFFFCFRYLFFFLVMFWGMRLSVLILCLMFGYFAAMDT